MISIVVEGTYGYVAHQPLAIFFDDNVLSIIKANSERVISILCVNVFNNIFHYPIHHNAHNNFVILEFYN
jgi:hypothetical protein